MNSAGPGDLKRAAARGVAWKITAELVSQATRLVVLLILARLLVPSEFGVAGIVIAFAIFVPLFADLGLGAALIQTPTLTEVERSTVFWTSLPLGLGFMGLGMIYTAMPVTNSVPAVVAAPPGIVTLKDLPPITGRGPRVPA